MISVTSALVTTAPGAALQVANGQVAGAYVAANSTTVNWNQGNVQSTNVNAGTITFTTGTMLNGANMIDTSKPLRLESLGLKLPETPPTQVISIRLPTALINEIKALGSRDDVPYQALIKLILADGIKKKRKTA